MERRVSICVETVTDVSKVAIVFLFSGLAWEKIWPAGIVIKSLSHFSVFIGKGILADGSGNICH